MAVLLVYSIWNTKGLDVTRRELWAWHIFTCFWHTSHELYLAILTYQTFSSKHHGHTPTNHSNKITNNIHILHSGQKFSNYLRNFLPHNNNKNNENKNCIYYPLLSLDTSLKILSSPKSNSVNKNDNTHLQQRFIKIRMGNKHHK